ncbi:acid-sensing ion channel 4 [Lepeophtheirus salmonis]|uniref:acid-sensing ion channel 4 n=1 Tax=Lepeophtheirus salmonis TaxID=72036 RepID=UPI001AE9A598|nr:uncharacterized protein LOC121118849 [Lepeophtheirus salmonis]
MELSTTRKEDQTVHKCFYDFCRQTILHGWHYLAVDDKSEVEVEENEVEILEDSREEDVQNVEFPPRILVESEKSTNTPPSFPTLEKKKRKRKRKKRKKKNIFNFHAFRSAFWTLIVSASVISGGFFLYNNTREFLNATVQTTLDGSVSLSEVFFPSVVVCNINQIRKSFFSELGFYENDTLVRIMYEDFIKGTVERDRQYTKVSDQYVVDSDEDSKRAAFYDVLKVFLEKRNLSVEGSITWLSHQKCDDMFIFSKWNSTITYNFGENKRDFGTDYGICCWYTPQLNFSDIPTGPDTDWAYWFNSVPKGAKTGKDNGFSVLFDIESFDYGYYDEGSEGLKVAVVHHLDMPIIRQRAFHVAPGTENQIPVTPTLYTATEQVLERFRPRDRDCYDESEIDLMYLPKSHGYRYEMSNCLFEAAYEKILERCHCAPGFHNEGGATAYQQYPVCQGKQLTCSNNILNRMGEFNEVEDIIENKTKPCLTNCEDQINDLFVTTSNYPNKKTFKEREEFCLLVKKLLRTCQGHKRLPLSSEYPNLCSALENIPNVYSHCSNPLNRWRSEKLENKTLARILQTEIYNYARENLAIINIFIKESYTKRFRKTEKMSRISYIASSGGLLGLCMGFSFVSLAEILYHIFLCLGLFCKRRTSRFISIEIERRKTRKTRKETTRTQQRLVPVETTTVNNFSENNQYEFRDWL